MRIAIVSDAHYPSIHADTEVTINTAAALGAAGAAVTLMIPFMWRRTAEEILSYYAVPDSFEIEIVHGWPVPERTLRIEKLVHGMIAPFRRCVREADVVHTRNIIPLVGASFRGARWSYETYRRHAEEMPWLRGLFRRVDLSGGVGAVAHGEASRNDLLELGLAPDSVIVARPGVALHRYTPMLDKAEARRQCDLPLDEFLVGYIGNIEMYKGIAEVLDVAARVPRVRFVVVGGRAHQVDELNREASRRDLANIDAVGYRPAPQVAEWLFACDALYVPATHGNVNPSMLAQRFLRPRLPGVPLKIYSYLAAGRAIIAADQAINTELLTDGENALLVPPEDGDAGAAAVRRLIDDPELRSQLGRAGRAQAENYTWARRAEQMLEFFERRLRALGSRT